MATDGSPRSCRDPAAPSSSPRSAWRLRWPSSTTGSTFRNRPLAALCLAAEMKIGFVGVGNIGAPIAGQLLQAGHAVVVNDLRRAAADRLIAAGADWAESAAAAAADSEVVVTCLPGPPE